jgi:hypothetical protein
LIQLQKYPFENKNNTNLSAGNSLNDEFPADLKQNKMSDIQKIKVTVKTSNIDGAGTDGNVFLGICGREFFLDSSGNDFEKNSLLTYTFGVDANVTRKNENDPRKPQLRTEHLKDFPVYIRFEPLGGSSSAWNLKYVSIEVEGLDYGISYPTGLWLGDTSGKFCYLKAGKFGE